jgi:ribosomal protein S18 acetylase RimI-like enzyme
MDEIQIEKASLRDLPGVYRLERVCFAEDAWSLPDILATLVWPGLIRMRARFGNRLIGFVMGEPAWRPGISMITTIGVDPAFQKRGTGAALLERCEALLPGSRIRLTVREDNAVAIRLYTRFGYRRLSRLPDYYRRGQAGLLMEKNRETTPAMDGRSVEPPESAQQP